MQQLKTNTCSYYLEIWEVRVKMEMEMEPVVGVRVFEF